jgi:chromosome segregation protein
MKTLKLFSILFLFVLMALQSCVGKTEQVSTSSTDKTLGTSSTLESELKLTEAKLLSVESENKELKASNEMLSERLKELQEAAQGEGGDVASDSNTDSQSGGLSNQTRIALMGAKAIAEFKYEQAARKVESLTVDLSKRDNDLKKALVDLEIISQEREGLKKDLESLKAESKNAQLQMEDTLKKLESRLAEQNDVVSKIEGELDEKEKLLDTLKKAWSDATQLKGNAENQLAEIKNNFNECQKQNAQMKVLLDQSQTESTRITAELDSLKKELASNNVQMRQLQSERESYIQQIKDLEEKSKAALNKNQSEIPASGELDKSHSVIERLLEGVAGGRP